MRQRTIATSLGAAHNSVVDVHVTAGVVSTRREELTEKGMSRFSGYCSQTERESLFMQSSCVKVHEELTRVGTTKLMPGGLPTRKIVSTSDCSASATSARGEGGSGACVLGGSKTSEYSLKASNIQADSRNFHVHQSGISDGTPGLI